MLAFAWWLELGSRRVPATVCFAGGGRVPCAVETTSGCAPVLALFHSSVVCAPLFRDLFSKRKPLSSLLCGKGPEGYGLRPDVGGGVRNKGTATNAVSTAPRCPIHKITTTLVTCRRPCFCSHPQAHTPSAPSAPHHPTSSQPAPGPNSSVQARSELGDAYPTTPRVVASGEYLTLLGKQ